MKIHEKPHKQLTYAPHSVNGWYLVPAVNHYICYTCSNIDDGEETTPDTIDLVLEFMKMSNYSSRNMAIYAAADLEKALQTPRPESTFQVGDAQNKATRELSKIFDVGTKNTKQGCTAHPPRLANE